MKKYFLTCAFYPKDNERYNLFYQFSAPRVKEFCKLHGFKHVDVNLDNFTLPTIFKQLDPDSRASKQWARWYILREAINKGALKEGDIVNYIDTDVFIVQPQILFQTNKSYSYAIDSGNTHCTGIFSLKVNSFTRSLIDNILSQERYDELVDRRVFSEHDNEPIAFYGNDQQAYYSIAGIKPHSWTSFFDLPNKGFLSQPTDYTCYSLDELNDNIEIYGPEWNTTHLIDETGNQGQPNIYDIVRTTKEKVINRHFAGDAMRMHSLMRDWNEYSKQYDKI